MVSIREIAAEAVRRGASDIHFCPDGKVKFRIKGSLEESGYTVNVEEAFNQLSSYLTAARMALIEKELEERGDSDFAVGIEGVKRFRVNYAKVFSSSGEGRYIVMREIREQPPELEGLNLPPDTLKAIKEKVVAPAQVEKVGGMFIIVGETGSGKSTTLAATIRAIVEGGRVSVITLEDPIEYLHNTYPKRGEVIQRELATHFDAYPSGLRAALRQDPNVILIGELRDTPTLEEALKAAETGHLVLTTLHANDSITALNRITFLAAEGREKYTRYRLAQVLIGILAQKLIKTNTGQRRLLVEALFADRAVKSLIADGEKDKQIEAQLDSIALCRSFEKSLLEMVKSGLITPAKARALTRREDSLLSMLERSNIKAGEFRADDEEVI